MGYDFFNFYYLPHEGIGSCTVELRAAFALFRHENSSHALCIYDKKEWKEFHLSIPPLFASA
jgi:hypothetical protein